MQRLFAVLREVALPRGFVPQILSGERSCAEQKALKSVQCSYHLSGDAIDVELFDEGATPSTPTPPGLPGIAFRLLQALAGARTAKDRKAAMYAILGARAEQLGFRWGGHFSKPDRAHFDDGFRLGRPAVCCPGPWSHDSPVDSGEQETPTTWGSAQPD